MSLCSDALFLRLREDLSFLTYDEQNASTIWPDATFKQYAAHSLLRSFNKKFVAATSETADDRALDKFLAVNNRCGNYSLRLDTSWDEILFGELKTSLDNFWHKNGYALVDHPFDVLEEGALGPGSNIGATGGDLYSKLFASPLTCTDPSLYEHYRRYTERVPRLNAAEINRADRYGMQNVVEGSRLNFAYKSVDISRLICTEPTLNMFYQLGFGAVLQKRLRSCFSIDLSDQPDYNRELARVGSVNDSYVTIDLSSASDSLALKMLEQILPASFYKWLLWLRCKSTSVAGKQVVLNMVSTMGNGFTFPLQTILFTCVVSACMRARGIPMRRNKRGKYQEPGNFGVFGDDIICEKNCANDVIRLLTLLGFQTNTEKTFIEGPFRESCGYDFFHGHNVRGFYLKSLKTQQDLCIAANGLNEWTAKTGIPLPSTLSYLVSRMKYQPVPLAENMDAGLRVPEMLIRLFGRPKTVTWNRNVQAYQYRRYISRSSRIFIKDGELILPRGAKQRLYNPDGLISAFLHGDVRSDAIGVRLNVMMYRTKWNVSSCWDNVPSVSRFKTLDVKKLPMKEAVFQNIVTLG